MGDPEPPDQAGDEPAEPPAERPMVRMLRVRCNKCRRSEGAALAYAMKRGESTQVPLCPHFQTVWAPGYGPGNPPPPWGESLPPV